MDIGVFVQWGPLESVMSYMKLVNGASFMHNME